MSLSRFPLPAAALVPLLLTLSGCGPSKAPDAAAPAAAPAPAKPTGPEPDIMAGKRVFTQICAACHQASGAGVPGVFPPLNGSEIVAEADPGRAIRIVLHGLQGPVEVKGRKYNSVMPGLGTQLKDEDIANVLSYVRATWGGDVPPVTADAVAAVRSSVKRSTPWTWAELTRQ